MSHRLTVCRIMRPTEPRPAPTQSRRKSWNASDAQGRSLGGSGSPDPPAAGDGGASVRLGGGLPSGLMFVDTGQSLHEACSACPPACIVRTRHGYGLEGTAYPLLRACRADCIDKSGDPMTAPVSTKGLSTLRATSRMRHDALQ